MSENLTACKIAGVFWNHELDSLEIHFSEEETPFVVPMDKPVKIYAHETGDGRIMKIEIGGIDWKR